MIPALTNHLWQSTLFAVTAGLLAFAMRRNGAHVRHWVWLTASIKFIVPFSLLMSVGSWFARPAALPQASPATTPDFSVAIDQIVQPFSAGFMSTSSAPQATGVWTIPTVLFIGWGMGFLGIALIRWRGWRHVRSALRASTALTLLPVGARGFLPMRSSPGTLEPGVVGWFHPVLLVPAGIDQHLTASQLRAVLAHELCHVRRRDNLTAAIHMVVEAVFWFHPLVWWIGARMVDERERACDEHVLRECGEPQVYAEGILNVCKLYVESPLTCVSGVTGDSNLKRRIEAILINRIGVDLDFARKAALLAAAVLAVALPIAAGTITARLHADSQVASAGASAKAQKFEVASIKPCEPQQLPPGTRSGGGNFSNSPGYTMINCMRVAHLINMAYVQYGVKRAPDDPIDNWGFMAGGQYNGLATEPQKVRGGPGWAYSDKYSIEAKAAGAPGNDVMLGPMLRSLLEDRFQLKFHIETEEVRMWALTVAKGGLKIKPMKDGDCNPDRSTRGVLMSQAVREGIKPTCGVVNGGPNGTNWRWEHGGQSLGTVAGMLSADLGAMVLDRTGVTDKFNFMWEYGPDDTTPRAVQNMERFAPAAGSPTAPNVVTALEQQLGLKLERIKGPRAYIVIDKIERPSPDVAPPVRATGPAGR